MRTGRWMARAVAAACVLTWTAAAQAQVLIYMKAGGEPKRGTAVRFRASPPEYILDTEKAQQTFPAKDVDRVEMPKPAAIDQAEKFLAEGRTEQAKVLLTQAASDYVNLGWDMRAQELLAQVYAKIGDHAQVVSLCKSLIDKAQGGQVSPQLRFIYWNSMLALQRFAPLEADLKETLAKGSRSEAAFAQLTRANLRSLQSKSQDALLDYLRAVILYEDIAEVQPEALYKAADLMEKMRDGRGLDLRARLKARYPGSDWVTKLNAR